MSDINTSLVPAESAPVAPVETDPVAVMTQIIAEHSNIPIEAREQSAPIAPVAPSTQSPTQPDNLAPWVGQTAGYESESYRRVEADLVGLLRSEKWPEAYHLGAAVLNQMPDLIVHNSNYILGLLGLGPDDVGQHSQARQQEAAENARADFLASHALSSGMTRVFDEFVAQGKADGLNDLEASGLAAIAYREFEKQYWSGDGGWRRACDEWHRHLRGNDKFQSDLSESSFRKAFGAVYRGVLQAHRPGAQPRPAARYLGRVGDAGDVMLDIMRQHGAV